MTHFDKDLFGPDGPPDPKSYTLIEPPPMPHLSKDSQDPRDRPASVAEILSMISEIKSTVDETRSVVDDNDEVVREDLDTKAESWQIDELRAQLTAANAAIYGRTQFLLRKINRLEADVVRKIDEFQDQLLRLTKETTYVKTSSRGSDSSTTGQETGGPSGPHQTSN